MAHEMTLAQVLHEARLNTGVRGLSQQDAAEIAGISPQYLCDIEQGRRIPPPDTLARLAAVYSRDIGELCWRWFIQQAGRDMAEQVKAYLDRPA